MIGYFSRRFHFFSKRDYKILDDSLQVAVVTEHCQSTALKRTVCNSMALFCFHTNSLLSENIQSKKNYIPNTDLKIEENRGLLIEKKSELHTQARI